MLFTREAHAEFRLELAMPVDHLGNLAFSEHRDKAQWSYDACMLSGFLNPEYSRLGCPMHDVTQS